MKKETEETAQNGHLDGVIATSEKEKSYLEIRQAFEKLSLAERAEITMFLWGKTMKECNAGELDFNGKFKSLGLKVFADFKTETL